MLSCGGGGGGGGPTPTPHPGFALEAITLSNGGPPTPTFSATPSKTPKATPTLTPRPVGTSTNVIGPTAVPTTVAFDAIGTFKKHSKVQFQDLTTSAVTLWTSTDPNILTPPASGPNGGVYTTALAGCVCVAASSSGVISQQIGVGVFVDVDTCPACPTAIPTATPTPKAAGVPAALTTPTAPARSAGALMWVFDAGSELRGRIATGANGSIFFITRDGALHGVDNSGKEFVRGTAEGSSVAALADGSVIAMVSKTSLGAIGGDGSVRWSVDIGASEGPLAVGDRAIYASAGGDLVSVSTTGALNWRVGVGSASTAATTPDGVIVGAARGAVTALASDGAVLWTFRPDGGFSGSVAYADEVVYAGSSGGGVYAIDLRTGNPIWHAQPPNAVKAGPVVAPSGTIFAGADTIYGVSSEGRVRWKDATLKPGDAGLAVLGHDGVFDAAVGDLGAVLMGDGSYVWTARGFGKITTATSSASGVLYVGTSTGRVFAVR
jgi:outer membrane protein assembly factor BamB